ncbi:integral membrane protein [Moniliophthora roreri]|nr:integral membrane protein [Moniliophthora roreri]
MVSVGRPRPVWSLWPGTPGKVLHWSGTESAFPQSTNSIGEKEQELICTTSPTSRAGNDLVAG